MMGGDALSITATFIQIKPTTKIIFKNTAGSKHHLFKRPHCKNSSLNVQVKERKKRLKRTRKNPEETSDKTLVTFKSTDKQE